MSIQCEVMRIHLKTGSKDFPIDREKLINFCLHNKDSQCVAIGWSCVHNDNSFQITSFEDYYIAVEKLNKQEQEKNNCTYRMNPALNKFYKTKENDLFWTRDTNGNHWICRAKGKAEAYYDAILDIGSRVPVEAYMCGLEVPGQIKASFSRARGGISETFHDDLIITYSQHIFNKLSGRKVYHICMPEFENILDNLPAFDLEELVISYVQIMEGYYVLSNSIAKNSTTIKIECEFRSRDKNNPKRAVLQVGGKDKKINAEEYKDYTDNGYTVYFFAPTVLNIDKVNNGVLITRKQLLNFYHEYKSVLPDSITMWETLFT